MPPIDPIQTKLGNIAGPYSQVNQATSHRIVSLADGVSTIKCTKQSFKFVRIEGRSTANRMNDFWAWEWRMPGNRTITPGSQKANEAFQ
jgi:hypothetical protein